MNQFPREVLKSVGIYRLPSSGSQSYPGSASSTVQGAFMPMNARTHALEGGIYQNPHELYVATSVDIKPSDKVVIDTVTYYVKQI